MCLAVPGKIISSKGNQAVADLHGNQVPVSTVLVPEAEPGDWVLVHAGFAIQRLDAGEAQQTFAVIKDLEDAGKAEKNG